jgi:hypothetical protein
MGAMGAASGRAGKWRTRRRVALAASITLVSAHAACAGAPSSTGAPSDGGGAIGADAGTLGADGSPAGFDGSLFTTTDAEAGAPCEASTDCPSGMSCLYPVAEGCSGVAVCTVLAAAQCGGPFCSCSGVTTAACGGYAELPMLSPLHGPPCGALPEDSGADGATDAGSGHD